MKNKKTTKTNAPAQGATHQSDVHFNHCGHAELTCVLSDPLDCYIHDNTGKALRPTIIVFTNTETGQVYNVTVATHPPVRRDLKPLIERTFAQLKLEQRPPQAIVRDDQPFKKGQGGQ